MKRKLEYYKWNKAKKKKINKNYKPRTLMHTESSLCAKLQSWSEDIEAYKNKKPAILKLHVSVNKHLRLKNNNNNNPLEKCYTKPPCGHVKWDYLYNFILFFVGYI